jgi:TetR/AcrR family transcriptional regulator, lmrAB and yxaGH operons repressor
MSTQTPTKLPAARVQAASRDELIAALHDLFRCKGFEGVSLADISAATGLGKSSLYHHFPAGKADMAEAVGGYALEAMRKAVIAPLNVDAPLEKKVAAMLATVDALYAGGEKPCLVANMLPSGAAASSMRSIIAEWIAALAGALRAAGEKPAAAQARAIEAVGAIEGALIVGQALGDQLVFRRMLISVGRLLTP